MHEPVAGGGRIENAELAKYQAIPDSLSIHEPSSSGSHCVIALNMRFIEFWILSAGMDGCESRKPVMPHMGQIIPSKPFIHYFHLSTIFKQSAANVIPGHFCCEIIDAMLGGRMTLIQ
jgi:hypothetical protein